jgi:adenosine/AMP kinase
MKRISSLRNIRLLDIRLLRQPDPQGVEAGDLNRVLVVVADQKQGRTAVGAADDREALDVVEERIGLRLLGQGAP